ncbi:MAG: phenylpyruvate tautomerase MIF-related protein [bacterium]
MPLLTIETNHPFDTEAEASSLSSAASRLVSTLLSKPEQYVMVRIRQTPTMLFAGSSEPLAYLELKSIGLPLERCSELSAELCDFLEASLGIPASRTFINFSDVERKQWGWNADTF